MVRLWNEDRVPGLKGTPAGFAGTGWRDEIVRGEPPHDVRVYRVSFEPGARTAWHTHPSWQILHVVPGRGQVQPRGGEVLTLGPGDTAWIDAHEEHRHGARPGRHFVHIAIHEARPGGDEVVWLEHVQVPDDR